MGVSHRKAVFGQGRKPPRRASARAAHGLGISQKERESARKRGRERKREKIKTKKERIVEWNQHDLKR